MLFAYTHTRHPYISGNDTLTCTRVCMETTYHNVALTTRHNVALTACHDMVLNTCDNMALTTCDNMALTTCHNMTLTACHNMAWISGNLVYVRIQPQKAIALMFFSSYIYMYVYFHVRTHTHTHTHAHSYTHNICIYIYMYLILYRLTPHLHHLCTHTYACAYSTAPQSGRGFIRKHGMHLNSELHHGSLILVMYTHMHTRARAAHLLATK
jgi:hypothetical protein